MKRIFAILLSAAVSLSCLSIPSLAASSSETSSQQSLGSSSYWLQWSQQYAGLSGTALGDSGSSGQGQTPATGTGESLQETTPSLPESSSSQSQSSSLAGENAFSQENSSSQASDISSIGDSAFSSKSGGTSSESEPAGGSSEPETSSPVTNSTIQQRDTLSNSFQNGPTTTPGAETEQTYAVSYSSNGGGNVTVTGPNGSISNGEQVAQGTSITISATANQGYVLESLQVNNKDFTSGSTYTVQRAVSIVATFSQESSTPGGSGENSSNSQNPSNNNDSLSTTDFTLSISTLRNGTLKVTRNGEELSNGAAVQAGDRLTIQVTANQGYQVDSITVNGETVENGGTYTVPNSLARSSSQSLSVQANISPSSTNTNGHTVSWTEPANGSISVKTQDGNDVINGSSVAEDTVLVITATPDSNYQLAKDGLKVNNKPHASGKTYTVGKNDIAISATFEEISATEYTVSISSTSNGSVTVKDGQGTTISSGSKVAEGTEITITAAPAQGYALSGLTVKNGTNSQTYTTTPVQITVAGDVSVSAIFIAEASVNSTGYYKVEIPSIPNVTVTARTASPGFYNDVNGSSTIGIQLTEGSIGYVQTGTTVTFNIEADSFAYNIDDITNTADGNYILEGDVNSRSASVKVTVTENVTLGVTTIARSSSSSGGLVYAPIAVQDEDGEDLEDIDGDNFDVDRIASDGRITLDGVAPGQTIYIKLGENGFNPWTFLDCDDGYSHYASASDLVDDDLFKISINKDGDGKSLISSITQVGERNLDGTRGSYLKIVLKDSTTTEELKAEAEITFKARDDSEDESGNDGEWCDGDYAVLNLVMWINNEEATDSADTGDSIYINPDENDYNVFVWGDDRAALEFYADDDAEDFYARLSTKSYVDIYTEYGDPVDAELWFYDFVGNPDIPCTSRASLTLGIPWDDDDWDYYSPEDFYIYELDSDGYLVDVTDRFTYSDDDYEIPGWTIRTRVLGTYVVSDTELDLDSVYEVDYDDDYEEDDTDTVYEEEYEPLNKVNPVTGGGDYYYTPVAEPANYSVSNTYDSGSTSTSDTDSTDAEADEDEEDTDASLTTARDVAVEEAIPQPSSDEGDEESGWGMLPGILLLAAAGITLGGGVYWFYRRGKELSE